MAGRPVVFDFIARDRNYTGPVDKMERRTVHFGATMGRIGGVAVRAFGGFGVAAAGAAVAAVGLGLKTESANEQAAISFKHLLGGARQADRFLKQLVKFASDTPFELPGVEQAAQLLLGAGESARKILPDLRAIGDAASTTTNPVDAFDRTVLALSQSMNKGKLQTEEILQAIEAGIPIWKLLSEATGKPIPKLQDMATKGQLLTKDVLPKLFDQMHKDYGGAMSEQSTTLAGRWSTLKDTISQSLAGAMVPLADMLKNVLPAAGTVFQNAVKGVSDFITGTVIPGLHTARDWWDHNKDSVKELSRILADVFTTSAGDANVSVGDLTTKLGGLKGVLDRVLWATAQTTLDYIQFARAAGNVSLRFLDLVSAGGQIINVIDKLSGGTGHAGDSMVRWARDMKDKTRVQLGKLAQDAKDAQAVIDRMEGKDIPVTASLKLNFSPSYTQKDWVADRARAGRMAAGGLLRGPGGPKGDRIPIMASDREFMQPADAVAHYGVPFMEAIRKRKLPRFFGGGAIRSIDAQDRTVNKIEAFGTGIREHANIAAFLKAFGGGNIKAFIRAADSHPYIWGGVGPGGWDCSGITGSVYALMRHQNPYRRYFTTASNFAGLGFKPGPGGRYTIGVNAAGGHMAGNYGGLAFEAANTRAGIRVGSAARGVSTFPAMYHMASGGLVEMMRAVDWLARQGAVIGGDPSRLRVGRFDQGGALAPHSATLALNGTSRWEPVGDGGHDYGKLADAIVGAMRRAGVGQVILDGRRVDRAQGSARISNARLT